MAKANQYLFKPDLMNKSKINPIISVVVLGVVFLQTTSSFAKNTSDRIGQQHGNGDSTKTGQKAPGLDLLPYVNTLQGSHNTPEFSHGRCSPLVGLPQGVNLWGPAEFSYVNASVRGVGGSGFALVPLTSKAEGRAGNTDTTFDPDQIEGKPDYFKISTKDGISSEMSPTE